MIEKSRVVEIRQGGEIFYIDWEDGKYVERNVTRTINNHLMEPCYFEDGLKLRDIFKLVETNKALFELIIPYGHIEEIIAESKKNCSEDNDESKNMSLLLSWAVEHEKDWKELTSYICFDGAAHTDKIDEDDLSYGKYGLDFLPSNHIINCEIKQNSNFDVWGGMGYKIKASQEPLIKLGERCFTLYEVIHAIFWELTFYGTPDERKEKGDELSEIVKDIEHNGVENLTSFDPEELMKDIEELVEDVEEK